MCPGDWLLVRRKRRRRRRRRRRSEVSLIVICHDSLKFSGFHLIYTFHIIYRTRAHTHSTDIYTQWRLAASPRTAAMGT
jgi:hypothetical protein